MTSEKQENAWNVGIIGCGLIAGINDFPRSSGAVSTHAQAYYRHNRFNIHAAVSPLKEELDCFSKTWHVPNIFITLEEMLDAEKLSVISLCSPSIFHFEHAMRILSDVNHPEVLFLEKPLCMDISELERLEKEVSETSCHVLVNHKRRFDPAYRQVAETIKNKELYRLLQGRCIYNGGWLNNGPHLIDVLYMFFDKDITVKRAEITGESRHGDPDITALLRLDDVEIHVMTLDEKYYQLFEMEFMFEMGRVQLFRYGENIEIEMMELNRDNERVLVPHSLSPLAGLKSPLENIAGIIAACLEGKPAHEELGIDIVSAAKTMRTVFEVSGKAKTITGNSRNE